MPAARFIRYHATMSSETLLKLDPKVVFDLAARVDSPDTIARRYDLDEGYLGQVMQSPHVQRLVETKRKELNDAGYILATKAKLMFEDLLPDLYRKAKGEGATLAGILDAAKFLRTVAGLDKQDAGNNASERFSITIQFGGGAAPAPDTRLTIDGQAVRLEDPPPYVPRASTNDLAYSGGD